MTESKSLEEVDKTSYVHRKRSAWNEARLEFERLNVLKKELDKTLYHMYAFGDQSPQNFWKALALIKVLINNVFMWVQIDQLKLIKKCIDDSYSILKNSKRKKGFNAQELDTLFKSIDKAHLTIMWSMQMAGLNIPAKDKSDITLQEGIDNALFS